MNHHIAHRLPAAAAAALALALVATNVTGCGNSGGTGVSVPQVAPAKVFALADFAPATPVRAGRPTTISFVVQQPSGEPLTQYKTGTGPHTGVHLIIVRDDLAYIIHQHPPVGPGGLLRQTVTFPAPGPYRVLVDVYPNLPGGLPNFQLYRSITVAGAYHPKPLPPFKPDQVIDGYHIDMQPHPALHAIQAQFISVTVTDRAARKVTFTPWFGALAHAIFFHKGSLDYFHSHICAPDAPTAERSPASARAGSQATRARPASSRLACCCPSPGYGGCSCR